MANIVVTSTTNLIKVDFGVYATSIGIKKGTWRKASLRFELKSDESFVRALPEREMDYSISFDGSTNTFQVDSVDGVAPTSNSDLYDKLITLIS